MYLGHQCAAVVLHTTHAADLTQAACPPHCLATTHHPTRMCLCYQTPLLAFIACTTTHTRACAPVQHTLSAAVCRATPTRRGAAGFAPTQFSHPCTLLCQKQQQQLRRRRALSAPPAHAAAPQSNIQHHWLLFVCNTQRPALSRYGLALGYSLLRSCWRRCCRDF